MKYRLPNAKIQSVYQPYTTKTYEITKTVKNVDLGYNLAATKVYPVTSYINAETPIYKAGETFTTTNYISTTPTYIVTKGHTTANYETIPTASIPANYPLTNYNLITPDITAKDYTKTTYQTKIMPVTTINYRTYKPKPVVTSYQGITTPVPISYQNVSAPFLQSVTIDRQVTTTRIQPKLATKYAQVPATKIVPIEQARTISLVPPQTPTLIPATSLIKINQLLT